MENIQRVTDETQRKLSPSKREHERGKNLNEIKEAGNLESDVGEGASVLALPVGWLACVHDFLVSLEVGDAGNHSGFDCGFSPTAMDWSTFAPWLCLGWSQLYFGIKLMREWDTLSPRTSPSLLPSGHLHQLRRRLTAPPCERHRHPSPRRIRLLIHTKHQMIEQSSAKKTSPQTFGPMRNSPPHPSRHCACRTNQDKIAAKTALNCILEEMTQEPEKPLFISFCR